MASSNSTMKVVSTHNVPEDRRVGLATAILADTTAANMPGQLDKLARLLTGSDYALWVRKYQEKHGAPWVGGG